MNAAETIQAAIEKLERFKVEADSSDWATREVEDERASAGLEPVYEQVGSLVWLYASGWEADAELIVTLHRTIDAQLAILRGLNRYSSIDYGNAARALARAILGEES